MVKNTPSIAKNQMRRCLHAIVHPHPSAVEVSLLWEHFDSSCAYCGARVERSDRVGHVDHLVAHSAGGSNSIYNHVLSCARCNGNEKREENWESFLSRKVPSQLLLEERRLRINQWLLRAPTSSGLANVSSEQVESIVSSAIAAFDAAVEQIRALRRNEPNPSLKRTPNGAA